MSRCCARLNVPGNILPGLLPKQQQGHPGSKLCPFGRVWTLKGLFADGQDASSQPNEQSHVVVAASSPIRLTNHATKLNVNPSHALQHASTQTEVRLSLSLL